MAHAIDVKNTFVSTDVICVKFFGSFVLAGVGGILKIYSLPANTCIKETEVFKGHKIYGIHPHGGNHILIYGSKSVQIFLFSESNSKISLSCVASLMLEDWIVAAHWLSNGTEIALVTAHNVAWLWPWMNGSTTSLQQATCTEKCILYSSTVCGDEWTDCVVFAGTVFREVVVWCPAGTTEVDQPVLLRLEGHNGVIFSLTWDWKSNSLCSTSDDRSIRLWNFSHSLKSDWKNSQVTCSNVLYGHAARVWKSIILDDLIISVGEDCHICMWSREGKLLQTLDRSTSGCQWSLDYSASHQLLALGAGDGSIQLLPLDLPLRAPSAHPVSYPETVVQSISSHSRKIIMLMSGCIVTITDDGTLLSGYPNIASSWKIICQDDRFSNYCLLSVAPGRKYFSLASLQGFVVIYQGTSSENITKVIEQKVQGEKIWSLLWVSCQDILVCGDEGRLMLWQLHQSIHQDEWNLQCLGLYRLPRSRERWPTCATLLTQGKRTFLICGDRCGSVHLYIDIFKQNSMDLEHVTPNHSLSKLHGHLGSTSVTVLNNKVLSTGRDGTVRTLRIDDKSDKMSVIATDRMPLEWVCCVLYPNLSPNHSLVIGFKETKMMIWSTEERRIILQVDCGGGHRSWDCIMSNKKKLEISFVREKQIFFASWSLETLIQPTLLKGISPKELNCVSSLENNPSAFLFGGEDGTIYLCKFSEKLCSLEEKITLTSHISSVRCICLHKNFFFSAGGRAQLKAWQIEQGCDGELNCIEEASHMLKGERNPQSPPSIDPEMRYMSICSVPTDVDNSSIVQLVAGFSDGALRWLTFDSMSRTIQVIGESMFHGKCVLKLLPFRLPGGDMILLSTATDGRIALWDLANTFKSSDASRRPFWSKRSHQSGINSIHAMLSPATVGTCLVCATGGDDNSVVLTALHLNGRDVSLIDRWSSSLAHAAQVTGVWLNEEWLISTSIDQRVTVWSWNLNVNLAQFTCNFVGQIICSVPDIQDMRVLQKRNRLYVCVVGKGVQILNLPMKKGLASC